MNTTQTIEQMKSLDSEVFRELGIEISEEIIRSKDGRQALINYNNWNKARKQIFLESMK